MNTTHSLAAILGLGLPELLLIVVLVVCIICLRRKDG